MAFPGTISILDGTLEALMLDYTSSLVKHGFQTIVFVPSHGGNFKPMAKIVGKIQSDFPEVNILAYTELMPFLTKLNEFSLQEGVSAEEAGAHAGESEASIMLYLEEELVKKERFKAGYVGVFGEKESQAAIKNGLQELTDIGILGDPSKASKEKGEKYIEQLADFLAIEIKQMFK
jgi:creatinine amidohydrolase